LEVTNTYKTLKKRSEGLYKEKGSKFIGIAVACYSEDEAKMFLEEWKKEHHQARHFCYAYRFGLDKETFRANDDGEPNNSAGAPILGQIQSFELSNVLIGVIRYYGGTKLGVGGLINAYRTAAKDALLNAKIVEIEVFHHLRLLFDYEAMPDLMNLLKQESIQYTNQKFDLSCALDVALPLLMKESLRMLIDDFETVQVVELGAY